VTKSQAQSAFRWLVLDLAVEAALARSLFVRAHRHHTRSHDRAAFPVTGRPPYRATHPRLGSPLGSPRALAERCVSPDVCNFLTTRSPEDRPIPDPAACATGPPRPRRPEAARFSATPDRLAAIRAPGKAAIDVAPSASAISATIPTLSGIEHPRCPPRAALSTAQRTADPPLTLPIAPNATLESPGKPLGARSASAVPPSRGSASALRSAFHRQVLPAVAFAASGTRHCPAVLPPTGQLPTLIRPPTLSRGRARPSSVPEGSSPSGALGHTPLADFCNRHRSTSTTIRPPNPAHRARSRLQGQLLVAGGLCDDALSGLDAWPAESSQVRGRLGFRLDARHPSGAIARAGSFAPTRSARTPHVANTG